MKHLGPIMLIAGTAIGSGMIALPMALAKLGIVPSIVLMFLVWGLMYYTSLISLELNLQAGKGLPLGRLGKKFSGNIAASIGTISFKVLSYALLSAYMYGGTSVLHKLFISSGYEYTFTQIGLCYAFCISALLMLPVSFIDYTNRFLFIGLLIIVGVLMSGLMFSMRWHDIALISPSASSMKSWTLALPILFCSFGFQVIFHTLTNYCNNNSKVLKMAFLGGSLIPGIIYIVWTVSVLNVLHHNSPEFYTEVIAGKKDVGDMIHELSKISSSRSIQLLSWWVSILAIITSVIGVGLGLVDSLKSTLNKFIKNKVRSRDAAVVLSILPACLVACIIPDAFIKIFAFAGMILVVIAIFLPMYLLYVAKPRLLFYKELSYRPIRILAVIAGVIIVACELTNLLA